MRCGNRSDGIRFCLKTGSLFVVHRAFVWCENYRVPSDNSTIIIMRLSVNSLILFLSIYIVPTLAS